MSGNKVGKIAVVEIWSKLLVDAVKDKIVVVVVALEVYVDCLLVESYGRLLEC